MFGVLIHTPVCDGDVPTLDYEVEVTGTEADTLTITFLHPTDPSQNVVYSDVPFSGSLLWPGAEIDDEGNPVDWPGWSFVDGVWVEGDEFDWVRPSVQVRFEADADAEATVTVDYPPSSPDCDANPPEGEVGGVTDLRRDPPADGHGPRPGWRGPRRRLAPHLLRWPASWLAPRS